jgi:Tfp pilus assembly major pilin PilA
LPRLTYGIQIYGVRKKNLNEIKKIYNRAVSMMVGKNNLSRSRVYQEFDLPTIEEITLYYRLKSFKSWQYSRSIASSLIKTSYAENIWNKKTTWCNSTVKWMVKNNVDPNDTWAKVKLNIKRAIDENTKTLSETKISKTAREYGLNSGKHLIKKESTESLANRKIYRFIINLRIGNIVKSSDLMRMKKLKPDLHNKCISCLTEIKDTIGHLLLECQGFEYIRKDTLDVILSELKATNRVNLHEKLLSYILEGSTCIIGNKDTKKMIFLKNFIEVRKAHVIRATI